MQSALPVRRAGSPTKPAALPPAVRFVRPGRNPYVYATAVLAALCMALLIALGRGGGTQAVGGLDYPGRLEEVYKSSSRSLELIQEASDAASAAVTAREELQSSAAAAAEQELARLRSELQDARQCTSVLEKERAEARKAQEELQGELDAAKQQTAKGGGGDSNGGGEAEKFKKEAEEARRRLEEVEKDKERAEGEVRGYWVDIVSAAEADARQLKAYLAATPAWLADRRKAMKRLPARGIVVSAAGPELLANAFTHAYVMRYHLGVKLPITFAYWGLDEKVPSDSAISFFKKHLSNVEFTDSSKLQTPLFQRSLTPRRKDGRFYGWKTKIAAIYTAPYQSVLFLDADCMPLLDPEFLFEWPEFKEKGNIFFPEHHAEQVRLFQYWGLYNPWAEGRDRKSMPLQAESGMLLMNRIMTADVLEWVWFLNTHDELTYKVAHGDKDTFRAAFDLAGRREDYYQSPWPSADGLKDTKAKDLRYFKHGMLQLAPNGSAAFVHRVWFNKYDSKKDETRAFEYSTIENSSGRARMMRWRWGLNEKDVKLVPESECRLNFYDMPASQEKCGFDWHEESSPVPIFAIPKGSYVATALAASDDAFALLRSAMKAGTVKLE